MTAYLQAFGLLAVCLLPYYVFTAWRLRRQQWEVFDAVGALVDARDRFAAKLRDRNALPPGAPMVFCTTDEEEQARWDVICRVSDLVRVVKLG